MPYFKFIYQKLPGDPEKNRENITYGNLLRMGIRNQQFSKANQEQQPLHQDIGKRSFA
jgi:hypothetical protein